jgi:mannose-6-phosphate isomerase-like protein (cupin superfamily)
MNKGKNMNVKIVEKPWGKETIWAHTEHYVGKILFVKANEALSIQYHNQKDETMYVLSGMGIIKFYDLEDDMPVITKVHLVHAGESVHIPPMQVHNVEAISDMNILEASTNHLDDLVRVSDRYNRG